MLMIFEDREVCVGPELISITGPLPNRPCRCPRCTSYSRSRTLLC